MAYQISNNERQGQIPVDKPTQIVESDQQILQNTIESYLGPKLSEVILQDYKNNVDIATVAKKRNNTAFTKLELCPKHCSGKRKCDDPDCDKLHICKFYLLSNSCSTKHCPFGHDISTDHNNKLLCQHHLENLEVQELRNIFSHVKSRSPTTTPQVCRFYNEECGCSKEETAKKCPFLHLCKFYVKGSCRFDKRCIRSHDILNEQVKGLLERYGINTRRTPKEVRADLQACGMSDSEGSDSGRVQSTSQCRRPTTSRLNNTERHQSKSNLQTGYRNHASGSDGVDLSTRPKLQTGYRNHASGSDGVDHSTRPKLQTGYRNHASGSDGVDLTTRPKLQTGYRNHANGSDDEDLASGSDYVDLASGSDDVDLASGSDGVDLASGSDGVDLSTQSMDSEICINALRGKCTRGKSCRQHHKDSMYQWQYMYQQKGDTADDDANWIDFESKANTEIERNYCEVAKDKCFAELSGGSCANVKFEEMIGDLMGKKITLEIRRLSTQSSVSVDQKLKHLATKWKWYRKDKSNVWIPYRDENNTSFEQNYQKNQKSVVYERERKDRRRRPTLVEPDEVEKRKKQ